MRWEEAARPGRVGRAQTTIGTGTPDLDSNIHRVLGSTHLPGGYFWSRTSENYPSRDCLETPNGLHFVIL
jgi:hypothetical protein